MVRGAGGLDQSIPVTYSDNIEIGKATAQAWYAGDANHKEGIQYLNFDIASTVLNDDTQTVVSEVEVPESDLPAPLTNEKDTSGEGSDTKGSDASGTGDSQSSSSGDDQGAAAPEQDAAETAAEAEARKARNAEIWKVVGDVAKWGGAIFAGFLLFFMTKRRRDEKDETEGNKEA